MKRLPYQDRDYAFGQAMLTLRSAIGLTQTGLADYLSVSRRSVGDWEAGGSYPKVDHLKKLIALAVEHHTFPPGGEADAIRSLWKAAHQKVLLDEVWLASLLAQGQAPARIPTVEAPKTPPVQQAPQGRLPRVDWDDALAVPTFYGREQEMAQLTEWVVQERCRVVGVLGLGGIGKSALSVSLMHRVAEHFDVVIWRSLRDAPTCNELLDECLQILAPQSPGQTPTDFDQRLNRFLEYLRGQRALIVLDNLETLLGDGEDAGRMLPGYEDYDRLLRRVGETKHQGCLLFTSREKPLNLVLMEGGGSSVRILRLAPLGSESCGQLLAEKGVAGSEPERARLIDTYAGNPLALKIVAQTIIDLFDGEITPFFDQGEIIFGSIRSLLAEHFVRLSAVEQHVLLWLAIMREPSTLDELTVVLMTPVPRARLLETIESLRRRSLIERGHKSGSFTLQSVVLEYATAQFIAEVGDEIKDGKLVRLIEHGLEMAHAREYVRQTQERLIVIPILAHLQGLFVQQARIEKQLLELLAHLTTWSDDTQGYAPANLVTLLRSLRGDLRGLDLSHLVLRNLYLQGIEMQDARLIEATLRDSRFTETFDAILAVAISSTGRYWAAASRRGEIRLWDGAGQNLQWAWRAHVDMIWALAFSPDGSTLASGSWDGTVKLWDIASGTLLWSGRHTSHINRMVFTPDGSLLASSGNDATVRLWEPQTGVQLEALPHPKPVVAITWNQDGLLLATGDVDGNIRLWETHKHNPSVCIHTIAAHTTWVNGLAFAPDGHTLASGSWDSTVKLWDVADGHLRDVLTGHTDRVLRLAWSADGSTLASSSRDQTMRLWDVETRSYRAILRGHHAGVDGLAFTPDSHNLLSGGEDGVLRLWDVASGQCIRTMQGHAPYLYVLDWSPDGTHLVSGGTDRLVTIWDITGERPPRLLSGHGGLVCGVGWSPDGRWIASSEWDNAIRLWDADSGDCTNILQHPNDRGNCFYDLAWSPDGQRLASGTNRHGVQIFEAGAGSHLWEGHLFPTLLRHIAWSPDGQRLAGGGDNGVVYVWNPAEPTTFQSFGGHQGAVKSIAWSPSGTRLASGGSGSDGGELFVCDLQHGDRVASLTEHSGIVSALAWGAADDLLVSGGGDGTLRWWDVEKKECLLLREAHQGTIQSLRRSPDGTTLACCGDDGAITLWHLQTGEHLQTLRRDRPYERLNITGIRGLTDAQKATLRTLGAVEDNRA